MKLVSFLANAPVVALLVLVTACGSAGAPAPSSGGQAASQQPTAQASAGGGSSSPSGGNAAPTVAPTAASKAGTSGSGTASGLEKVNIPSGSKFDPYKPVKVGDVVELPETGIVFQVTGAKTADYDAQKDLLLVDLVLGNKGKSKLTVSSVLMMAAFTSDWHHYSLAMDDLMQVAPKIAALKVSTFDGEVPVNEARKGTAVIPVPKSASNLGFSFSPLNMETNTGDPDVYVGLGLKGDFPFPIIPENVEALKAGTTYKVGQAVKAPKRGVAIQVNGARERTQSLPGLTINVSQKLVIVDITTRQFGTAADVMSKELRLADSSGKTVDSTVDSNLVLQAENGMAYRSENRRGHLVFMAPRDAKGLKLVFAPTADEKIEVDLGTLAQSTSAPASGSGAASSASAGPKIANGSTLPDELKSLPMPSGFGVIDGSVGRSAPGGKFESADATLFGKMSIKDLATFYKMQLSAQWESIDESVSTGELQFMYMNKKDESLNLYINAEQTDQGTTVDLRVEKS